MIGRSILSAAMRTRVATRSPEAGTGVAGTPDAIGGRVISGRGVSSTVASGPAVGVATGSAVTGVVNDRSPAARKVIPSAVRMAGMIRVRIQVARERIGRAS